MGVAKMQTNEELVRCIQTGERDKLVILWEQVHRLAIKTANRWIAATPGRGLEIEDYLQAAFIALISAVERFDMAYEGKFTTLYSVYLRKEYAAADGLISERQRRDPLRGYISLDIPIDKENPESGSLGELIPDPAAEAAMLSVDERDRQECLHMAMEKAISKLPEPQQTVIQDKYYRDMPVDQKTLRAAIRVLRHPSCSRDLREFLQV